MTAAPAEPEFEIGQTVDYWDTHDRPQTGAVKAIDATWHGAFPRISYVVEHPTYQNRRCHVSADVCEASQ